MSLVNRPAPAGDRLFWRPRSSEPAEGTHIWGAATTGMPSTIVDSVQADIEAHRHEGVRKALVHLAGTTTSTTYRRTRAHLALCRAVELQARVAGLGHVHVGTGPCGVMCQPMGAHRATPWRDGAR